MNVARRVALWAGLIAWIFSWFYFRELRSEAVGKGLQGGTAVLMGIASTVLIATAVAAGLKSSLWPYFSILGALLMILFVLAGQQALMNGILVQAGTSERASLADAFDAIVRTKSLGSLLVLSLLPIALLLTGSTGIMLMGHTSRPARA